MEAPKQYSIPLRVKREEKMAEEISAQQTGQIEAGDLVQYLRVNFPFRVLAVFRDKGAVRAHVEHEDPRETYFLELESLQLLKKGDETK
mgnify:CR=1 FL=1